MIISNISVQVRQLIEGRLLFEEIRYNLGVLGNYFECEGVSEMYLLQLHLVTTETFVVQRSRSSLPSMVDTTLGKTLDQ